jgi:hypothetical protein
VAVPRNSPGSETWVSREPNLAAIFDFRDLSTGARSRAVQLVVRKARFIATDGTRQLLSASHIMELRELIGYLCLLLAIAGTAGGIWAAWYYSPGRVYARQRMRERRNLHRARAGA